MDVVSWPMTVCKCTCILYVKLSRSAQLNCRVIVDSNIHAPAIVVFLHFTLISMCQCRTSLTSFLLHTFTSSKPMLNYLP